jgi:hypothetical protein
MTDKPDRTVLDIQQERRVECLRAAREILSGTGAPYSYVVKVARWLNTGEWSE